MVEGGDEPGLGPEALAEVAFARVDREDRLDRHGPAEAFVGRPPHLGHPPLAEELLEAVAAEPLSLFRHSSISRGALSPFPGERRSRRGACLPILHQYGSEVIIVWKLPSEVTASFRTP